MVIYNFQVNKRKAEQFRTGSLDRTPKGAPMFQLNSTLQDVFFPSSSALLYSDMILAVQGSYQHCVPLRSLLCRERKSQLRSLLRKERNILLRSWSNPGDQACGKAIQLALRTLNYLFRLPTTRRRGSIRGNN